MRQQVGHLQPRSESALQSGGALSAACTRCAPLLGFLHGMLAGDPDANSPRKSKGRSPMQTRARGESATCYGEFICRILLILLLAL